MQGVYVNGWHPKTKKELKEAVKTNPDSVSLQATSWHNDEYGGPIKNMPVGKTAYFVGPDPHTNRKWYGSILRKDTETFIIK